MTSTLQLTRYDSEDGIEILINSITGESFCSIRGYARMAGKDKSTIHSRVTGVGESTAEIAETLTNGGMQGVRLVTEDQITEWLPRDNPAAATLLLKMGVRMALHKMAGYEIKSTAMPEPQPITNPLDAQIQRAIALAGGGGALAIETFKMLNSLTAPTIPAIPSLTQESKDLTTHQKWVQDDRIIFDEFLSKLRIALDEGMLDGSMKADVTTRQGKYIAIHLLSVLDALESRLDYRPQATDLQRAIAKYGGKCGQNQRFEPESPTKRNGHRSIVRKCIVIPTSLF